MLHIKHKHRIDFPHITFSAPHPMELSAVPADDDELAQSIDSYSAEHENDWVLTDTPDTSELDKFWSTVVEEIKDDPNWVKFDDDKDTDWIGVR